MVGAVTTMRRRLIALAAAYAIALQAVVAGFAALAAAGTAVPGLCTSSCPAGAAEARFGTRGLHRLPHLLLRQRAVWRASGRCRGAGAASLDSTATPVG